MLVLSLGLIVGGAVGNAIDRIVYGAVFDFVHFHVGAWSWYVFNVADAAIVAGVVGLLYDSLVLEGRRTRQVARLTAVAMSPHVRRKRARADRDRTRNEDRGDESWNAGCVSAFAGDGWR